VPLLLALLGAPAKALAQQTIINLPSADQTKPGHFFFLHESAFNSWNGDTPNFYTSTNFLTYGVTKRFELATTLYNVGSPTPANQALGVGWKTAQPLGGGARQLTVTAGQMAIVNLAGGGFGLWNYAHLSGRLPGLGTRVAAGISAGPEQLFGEDTVHPIASIEQPLTGKLALVAEWFGGEHAYGDLVPGLVWHDHGFVVIVGYKLSNAPGTATDGLILEVGTTFKLF
jgi:hypothetical protein